MRVIGLPSLLEIRFRSACTLHCLVLTPVGKLHRTAGIIVHQGMWYIAMYFSLTCSKFSLESSHQPRNRVHTAPLSSARVWKHEDYKSSVMAPTTDFQKPTHSFVVSYTLDKTYGHALSTDLVSPSHSSRPFLLQQDKTIDPWQAATRTPSRTDNWTHACLPAEGAGKAVLRVV